MTTDERLDLIDKFREVANALAQDRDERFALLDVKFFLLAALNDVDRALAYGNPGAGIDDLLSTDGRNA